MSKQPPPPFVLAGCVVGAQPPPPDPQDGKGTAVPLGSLAAHASSKAPCEEFSRLGEVESRHIKDRSVKAASLPENRGKNRYPNILPFDSTRVGLSLAHGRGSDFINANWVCGIDPNGELDPHAFIATQGPMKHTVDDFWRMVWETDARAIIMLGREREMCKIKVDRYWPHLPCHCLENGATEPCCEWCPLNKEEEDGEDEDDDEEEDDEEDDDEEEDDDGEEDPSKITENGDVLIGYTMAVKIVSEEQLPDLGIIVRRFKLVPTRIPGAERDVVQYQYAGWPDHGAPASTDAIRSIIYRQHAEREQALKNGDSKPHPVVVHCSAGIGRTGAYCTIQTHVERMRQLKAAGAPQEWVDAFTVDAFWTVIQLRWCRYGMVQQIEQYAFCYAAILDEARTLGLIPGGSECDRSKIEKLTTLCTN